MDIKSIRHIVNEESITEDVKKNLILSIIALDKDSIPMILEILENERRKKNEWNMLWETKIARNDKKQTLCVSVWGNTESESRVKATEFLEILCKIF